VSGGAKRPEFRIAPSWASPYYQEHAHQTFSNGPTCESGLYCPGRLYSPLLRHSRLIPSPESIRDDVTDRLALRSQSVSHPTDSVSVERRLRELTFKPMPLPPRASLRSVCTLVTWETVVSKTSNYGHAELLFSDTSNQELTRQLRTEFLGNPPKSARAS
jgi:hypothetical protein